VLTIWQCAAKVTSVFHCRFLQKYLISLCAPVCEVWHAHVEFWSNFHHSSFLTATTTHSTSQTQYHQVKIHGFSTEPPHVAAVTTTSFV